MQVILGMLFVYMCMYIYVYVYIYMYIWDSLVAQTVKHHARHAGDPGSIPGWGRSPGEGNGNPLQYSCLENSMDGGAWWATVRGITMSGMI